MWSAWSAAPIAGRRRISRFPGIRDELKYQQRLELMGDNSIDTITFRNQPTQMALPIRRWSAFLPGEGVGGTGNHWGARALALSARRFPSALPPAASAMAPRPFLTR